MIRDAALRVIIGADTLRTVAATDQVTSCRGLFRGLFITLSDTGADGFIPISKIGDDYYSYDEVSHRLMGEDSGLIYQMGDEVEVKLVEAAPMAGALRFDMISDGRDIPGLPRGRKSRSGSPSGRPRRAPGSDKYGRRRSKGRKK